MPASIALWTSETGPLKAIRNSPLSASSNCTSVTRAAFTTASAAAKMAGNPTVWITPTASGIDSFFSDFPLPTSYLITFWLSSGNTSFNPLIKVYYPSYLLLLFSSFLPSKSVTFCFTVFLFYLPKYGYHWGIQMSINAAYIHIPFCRRRCFYCDFPITVLGDNGAYIYLSLQEEYVDFLCREIRATSKNTPSLDTIFFGGGTPSLLYLEGLAKILDTLSQHFGISNRAEISIEIDPATFDINRLKKYKSLGINRLSLGVQAFQDNLLQIIGRSHRLKDIQQAIDDIHRADFDNWGLDLISGLPCQTLDDWQQSLEKAIELQPKHISCYDLVLEPTTVFGKKYQAGKKPLPPEETTAKMYCLAVATLKAAGYHHYEISNYAKPGYQCRHNQVYWLNQPYYGFGMGAASYTDNIRFTRPRTRQKYYAWVADYERKGGILDIPPLSDTDRFLETLMLGLRLTKGVNLANLEAEYGQEYVRKLVHSLQHFLREKLVILDDNKGQIRLASPLGFLYSNTILATIFAEFSHERR